MQLRSAVSEICICLGGRNSRQSMLRGMTRIFITFIIAYNSSGVNGVSGGGRVSFQSHDLS